MNIKLDDGAFPRPNSDSYSDSYEMIPMQKLQWKLVKFHLIGTDIGAISGTVGIGIGIGIGLGSVETVLHIIIEPNFIGIGIGIGVGIGVGQGKHTMNPSESDITFVPT